MWPDGIEVTGGWLSGDDAMRVHIFQGGDELYGFTPQDNGGNLPAEYSPWRPLKSVEMDPDRSAHRIRLNETEVLAAIKRQGYCITDVTIEINGSESR
jgi:hypothetical protein